MLGQPSKMLQPSGHSTPPMLLVFDEYGAKRISVYWINEEVLKGEVLN